MCELFFFFFFLHFHMHARIDLSSHSTNGPQYLCLNCPVWIVQYCNLRICRSMSLASLVEVLVRRPLFSRCVCCVAFINISFIIFVLDFQCFHSVFMLILCIFYGGDKSNKSARNGVKQLQIGCKQKPQIESGRCSE